MYSLKDKVSHKLSHLFSHSHSHSKPPHENETHQATREEGKSLSCIFSSILPCTTSLNGNKHINPISVDIPSECEHKFENDGSVMGHPLNEQYFATPTTTLTDPRNSMPKLTQDSLFISLDFTLIHGISLRTLIRKSADVPGPCLLITGDTQGAVFGGLLEGPLTPTARRKYQGTNQTFVFTTIYGEPRLFRPTGANRYFYLCLNDLLALGGGGEFALRLDGDLLSGTSGPCDTFGNRCLAHNQEFELRNVELWGFTHSSKYTK